VITGSEKKRARLRCPQCRSQDLVLCETRLEHAEFAGGLFVNAAGRLEADGEAYLTPGEVQPRLTRITCESCGRQWRPRRSFDGIRARGAR
jgi:hypothetical protein